MKLLKHFCISLLLCATIVSAHAQQRKVTLSFLDPFPSIVDSSQTVTARVVLRNVDTAAIITERTYGYTVNGVLQPLSNAGLDVLSGSISIAIGDSLIDTLTLRPGGASFSAGPSVVVIWPIGANGNTFDVIDSVKFDIEVTQNPVGIGEITDGALYYANGRILLHDSKNELIQVRIWNDIGMEMYYAEGEHAQYIELPDLPAGIYIAEAMLSNNKRTILKFVKPLH